MNHIPVEILSLVFEHACRDDFGKTARGLGLVSKYFREIAEPIELRTVEVAGYRRLQGVVARIQKAEEQDTSNEAGRVKPGIRHLFISELTKDHALAADTDFGNGGFYLRSSFWLTEEGKSAEASYSERTNEFWELAGDLVKRHSRTLKTLFLLSSDNFYTWRGFHPVIEPNAKVLGIMSGMSFPNLTSLTINHNVASELRWFNRSGVRFHPPELRSLRRLHVISTLYMPEASKDRDDPEGIHPLVAFLLPSNHNLEHLILCNDYVGLIDVTMNAVFGRNWRAQPEGGVLPGTLRSVTLQQGIVPMSSCGTVPLHYKQGAQYFVKIVKDLQVAGLEAYLPAVMFPEPGKREYELLLADWKRICHEEC